MNLTEIARKAKDDGNLNFGRLCSVFPLYINCMGKNFHPMSRKMLLWSRDCLLILQLTRALPHTWPLFAFPQAHILKVFDQIWWLIVVECCVFQSSWQYGDRISAQLPSLLLLGFQSFPLLHDISRIPFAGINSLPTIFRVLGFPFLIEDIEQPKATSEVTTPFFLTSCFQEFLH